MVMWNECGWFGASGPWRAEDLRRDLERAVVAKYGAINAYHRALISSAAEAHRIALANRQFLDSLVGGSAPLSPEFRLSWDSEYSHLLDVRDAKIEALGLHRDDDDLYDVANEWLMGDDD